MRSSAYKVYLRFVATSRRYRLPVGPRRSPETYRIVKRDGKFLLDADLPYRWTERSMSALSFTSREKARAFIDKNLAVARERLGIKVDP